MTIKRGDLVMVVRPSICCGSQLSLGKTYTVVRIVDIDAASPHKRRCRGCRKVIDEAIAFDDETGGYHVSRLRRIDPPATGEYDGVPVRKRVPRKEVA